MDLIKLPDSDELASASGIDRLEKEMAESGHRAYCPVTHRFTPGMYIREIFIPEGTLITSKEHKTEHPFVISKGKVRVMSVNEGSIVYEAPFTGITRAGTRRVLYAEENTIWTTFHITDETDITKIGEAILQPNTNPLLSDESGIADQWQLENPKIETK